MARRPEMISVENKVHTLRIKVNKNIKLYYTISLYQPQFEEWNHVISNVALCLFCQPLLLG